MSVATATKNGPARRLRLGSTLELPLETAVVQRYGFVGRSGSGKTYACGKLVELMLDAGVQVVILDVVGIWYGLRVGADGGDGIAIPVFGGDRGDIPLQPDAGEMVADVVVDRGTSLVIDTSGFGSGGDLRRFATAFAERLFQRKKARREAMHLVLEEAQTLVPQRVMRGEERLLGAFEKISKIGRNYGIGLSLITQRPQAVHKDVLNQTELLLVGQTNGKQERDALQAWMTYAGGDINLLRELPHLPTGTMYAWSPAWLQTFSKVNILPKRTADVSETPKFGGKLVEARKLAPVDLAKIGSMMSQAVAEKLANDPTALKRRIAELEKQIATQGSRVVEVEKRVEVERVVTLDRDLYELRSMLNGAHDLTEKIRAALEPVERDKAGYLTAGHPSRPRGRKWVVGDESAPATAPATAPDRPIPGAAAARPSATGPTAEKLGKCATLILNVLRARAPASCTRRQIAILTGYAINGGGFNNALGELRSAGLMAGARDECVITPAGRARAGSGSPLPQGRAILAMWQRGKAYRLILEALYQHQAGLAKAELAEKTGYEATGGGFNNALGELRSLELISPAAEKQIRLDPEFFA